MPGKSKTKEKISIEPSKKRIPLPKKPPKVIAEKSMYKRTQNKDEIRKVIENLKNGADK